LKNMQNFGRGSLAAAASAALAQTSLGRAASAVAVVVPTSLADLVWSTLIGQSVEESRSTIRDASCPYVLLKPSSHSDETKGSFTLDES